MKGMMDGWHGDEYEVEYTWEELDDIACQKADEKNDMDWLDNYQNATNTFDFLSRSNTYPPNCSDIGVFFNVNDLTGVEHE